MRARRLASVCALALLVTLLSASAARASVLPTGFSESVVWSGQATSTNLEYPTNIEFAPDGRIFVAEKSGVIKVFDNEADKTATVFANLGANVHDFWDRGMLGMAVDPRPAPATPYVYVLYTYDAPIGGTPPTWGDGCPSPPGATADGCVVSGRLSRLNASTNQAGAEQVLINDWCQQFPSHSVGDLAFGADGALYVTGGDGASFNYVDYGQTGNPCGDPMGVGGISDDEGGALRSQDLRTTSDPTSLDGTVLRLNPDTGEAMAGNPNFGSSDPNARRIVAQGLRNPFRMTIRPGTSEVWLGDVGWNTWEEINRIPNPTAAVGTNFGWPCYEGAYDPGTGVGRQPGYDNANLNLCENLYAAGAGAVTNPYYAYNHSGLVVPGETCPSGGSSTAGIAFYPASGGPYPVDYRGALFFADYTRDCIWVMKTGGGALPNPNNRTTFAAQASNPVDLEVHPQTGELWYADFSGGTAGAVRKISFAGPNASPTAVAAATPTSGPAPLTVGFDGSGSTDPNGDALSYAWDLDDDGAFDDATTVTANFTYQQPGTYTPELRVTDSQGASDTDAVTVTVGGNTPPTATISSPASSLRWKVGDAVSFAGRATDPQDGTLPASALSWSLALQHCDSGGNCHRHGLQNWPGVASGSFVAPDHGYPSYLELTLTATDSSGLTDTEIVRLDPQTVNLTFQTNPGGLQLTVGGTSGTATISRTVIVGSTNTISAPTPQTKGKTYYDFSSWSDGGAQTHSIVAPATATTYTARFTRRR
jgi:glucose/arabinose dehydrogenase